MSLQVHHGDPRAHAQVRPGISGLIQDRLSLLQGRRVGLITNPAGVDARLRDTTSLLVEAGVRLVKLFGPEHGVFGDAQAGVKVGDAVDPRTGLPVYSLYGETRRPTPEMLDGLDVLVCDLQDVGVRYWTILYTMAYAMEAAAAAGIEFVVCDRPNPCGGDVVEGNMLDPEYRSFVGGYVLPMRHGMTMGEAAVYIAAEQGLPRPTVITAEGWRRSFLFAETGLPWVLPSPNMPTLETVLLYAGTCWIEGTTLSEGRGTTRPFELIGAPGLDAFAFADALNAAQLPGVGFRPAFFRPTFSKHQGELCAGVQIHVLEPHVVRAVPVGLHLLGALRRVAPEPFWRTGARPFIDLLGGGPSLRADIDAGRSPDDVLAEWEADRAPFMARRQAALLYS